MFSKEFLAYQNNIPSAPPMPDLGGANAEIPEEFKNLHVPMMPPDYHSPDPEIPEGFQGGKVTVNGVPGMVVTRPGVRENAAMMYIHGGGFTLGTGMTAGPLLAHILKKTNLTGYSVDYSLAPYKKFPVQVNECVAFYQGLLEKGYKNIVVGGESAGANLTLCLVHALKMQNLPLPAAIWCSSPPDDILFAQKEVFSHDMFTQTADGTLEAYAGNADPEDPRISPIYGDFADFPPTFIQAGTGESLAAGALRLVEKLSRAGNEVHFTLGKGMPHTFAMDYALYPEARNAMNEILTFICNVLEITEE